MLEFFKYRYGYLKRMCLLPFLFSNANKFTSEGAIALIFNVKEEENCVYFRVTDTGTGIPESKQKKVFERFGKFFST